MQQALEVQAFDTQKHLTRLEKKLLHYCGKAIADYRMIMDGDKVLVCLSGGKDSHTMLSLLRILQQRAKVNFKLSVLTLDQVQPGWDDTALRHYLDSKPIQYEILSEDTYSIVKEKTAPGKTTCSLCSRLRRGVIYRYAREHGFNKIALGHHRDDLIESLMMAILYNGEVRSMPPKLLTDDKRHIVIRPLVYCQEKDISAYAKLMKYPIIPCNLCGSQPNLARARTKRLIQQLAQDNPKIPSNMLHALQRLRPTQLMDHNHQDFRNLEQELISDSS